MSSRRSFRQRIALVVTGLGLVLLTTKGAWAAASLCHRVLVPQVTYSVTQIDAAIEQIAMMRLSLDLVQISGEKNENVYLKSLESIYPIKLQEIISSLQDQYSSSQVLTLIKKKIAVLQNQKQVLAEIEHAQRNILRTVKIASSSVKSGIFGNSSEQVHLTKYDGKNDKVYYVFHPHREPRAKVFEFVELDLKTGTTKVLVPANWAFPLKSPGEFLIVREDGPKYFVSTYNVNLGTVANEKQLNWPDYRFGDAGSTPMALSPNENIMIVNRHSGKFFDIKKNEFLSTATVVGSDIFKAHFVSDSEAIVQARNEIHRVRIDQGIIQSEPNSGTNDMRVHADVGLISAGRQLLDFASFETVYESPIRHVKTSILSTLNTNMQMLIKEVAPDGKTESVVLVDRETMQEQARLIDFAEKKEKIEAILADDGKSIVIRYNLNSKTHYEVWNVN